MARMIYDEELIKRLKCPICGAEMFVSAEAGASLLCKGQRRHCYDFSSSGYVNLMPPGHTDGGDSKEAVRARREFLSADLYRPVADELAKTLAEYLKSDGAIVVDAGCGEGYYTARIAEEGFLVSGVDLSRPAVDSAVKLIFSRGISRAFFCVGSVYSLPFADETVDAVVNVFAPCAEKEFCRALKKDGILCVVYAGRDHLMGLKRAIYDVVRENEERRDMPVEMELLEERRVKYNITLNDSKNIKNLFAMTPYYWKTSPSDSEKLNHVESLTTEVDMIIAVYKKTL